mmetsp:Transcript_11393/g.17487  ORF Transcript_11393/g.17487 Transcript_11393/m.17487 type:complete len:330 (+) Transcript_11393:117-1106(+)
MAKQSVFFLIVWCYLLFLLEYIHHSGCHAHKHYVTLHRDTKSKSMKMTKSSSEAKTSGKKQSKRKSKCPKTSKATKKQDENGLFMDPSCQVGDLEECVPLVIHELSSRLCELGCDHNVIFSLIYLYTTQRFLDFGLSNGDDFENIHSVVREDSLFADYYFRAYDAYHNDRNTAVVPPVWKLTFELAESKSIYSQTNGLLGVTAHIQRDLPLVLYELYKEGTPVSQADHFTINNILFTATDPSPIIQQFYDPIYPNSTIEGLTAVIEWRANAWEDYEKLLNADGNETEVDEVLNEIEMKALATAQFFASNSYDKDNYNTARDAYCESSLQ